MPRCPRPWQVRAWLGAAAMALLLIGCSSAPTRTVAPPFARGAVEAQRLPTGREGEHALKIGQSSNPGAGEVEDMPMPEVPDRWLPSLDQPLRIELLAVVDENGRVQRADIDALPAEQRCGECASDFEQAISAAARSWQLVPLEISDWRDVDTDGDGETDAVRREVVSRHAYSVRLALTFRRLNGRLSVVGDAAERKMENLQ
ncbi:hypothetical protein [Pseudomarimonas arenosa]|uniref:Lipoprotein n=1 Tax=Pseudomarimonas arenosa TaxID=2774145 RepID=A0AAW3ZLJ5_9GAMM|nr:hypothetical protein [Pseudomarimonas arenosa]MBD8525186.1 hypothetical protein [Pseudomarimonas arenosa]